ncbi:unnamed protein product [Diatraea saccharalis]|uniref:Zinc finger protein 830 n=1 Tax=Diatraea saccharalis TaxID=40085 RepID=A0A9N9WHC4_9NEOP|nr:unnamed protein product [Diatraea saccharalis]
MTSLHLQKDKKRAQDEMRRLMAERRKKDLKPIQINNPLAKYNNAGQLTCVLCSSIVRSEQVWPVHVNSKQHRENVENAKKLKEKTNNFTTGKLKHKLSDPSTDAGASVEKKIKGILKNAGQVPQLISVSNKAPQIITSHNEEIKRAPLNMNIVYSVTKDEPDEKVKAELTAEQPIPEGFFDDPILDAKVRNIEYKDPVEEEWEKFQKEIKEEASASAEIIAGEQEEATAERQIDEIDEQIRNWNKVLDLEMKKEETKKQRQEIEHMSENEDSDSNNDDNIDEFLDWRAKRS